MKISAFAAGALLLCAALGAAAQKVYRCGPDGSIYQQTPCAEGQAVDVSDPRTAEQRKQAQAAAKSDAQAAAKFDRDMTAASPAKGGKPRAEPARKERAASSPKDARWLGWGTLHPSPVPRTPTAARPRARWVRSGPAAVACRQRVARVRSHP